MLSSTKTYPTVFDDLSDIAKVDVKEEERKPEQ
jgi:hypothetical protein